MPAAKHPLEVEGIINERTVIHNSYYIIGGKRFWVEISFHYQTAYIILVTKHGQQKEGEFMHSAMPLTKAN